MTDPITSDVPPELKTAAYVYRELGIPIIPFKITKNANGEYDKQNLSTWKKWMDEPQTEQEFNALNWANANAFAVILGTHAKNGHYLSVIDYDTKGGKVSKEVKAKGKEILREFPITQTQETVNNGVHLVYWSRVKPKTDGTFHDDAALELLGEKKLCLMAPSSGYKCLNDNPPTEIENLEETFYSILKRHGFSHTEETEIENQTDNYSFSLAKIVDLNKLTRNGEEYQGSHPIHDSTTEKNFCVNTKTNTWHCFRHNSGGGALQFLAVKEGIIKCEQAKKGALRGKKFREVLKLAASQGLIDEKTLTQSEINPIILAKDLMEEYVFTTDKETNELYFYDEQEGIYSNKTEQLIKRQIAKRLDENFKTRYYNEIAEFITNTAPLVKMDDANPEILAVKNGLLNVLTRKLTLFSKDVYITNKLNVEYKPEVKYADSYNAKFLSEVVSNPTQRKQIQELIGHCLYKKIIAEVSLVCLGKGGNGKSIFLTTIKNFLGLQNVSSHTIQQLCYDKFVIAQLKHKLANICADLPHQELMNTGTYKAIVSGDSVQIEIKHVQGKGETLDPYTKYLYSANHLPPIQNEEDCYAWYRRFIFADFKKTFTTENSIPRQELLTKLTTPEELTALLNGALEGLERIYKNGDVSNKPSVEEIRKEYRKRSSSTLAYFDNQITVTDNYEDFVFTDDWFRDYVTYCHNNKIKPKSKGEFSKDVEQHLAGVRKTKIRPAPKTAPISAWRFVKFVPSVPTVPVLENLRGKKEKNKNIKKPQKLEKFIENGTDGTNGTECKVCGSCVDFRTPICPSDNWKLLSESESALGKPCFKLEEEQDDSEDYPEQGEPS